MTGILAPECSRRVERSPPRTGSQADPSVLGLDAGPHRFLQAPFRCGKLRFCRISLKEKGDLLA